MKKKSKFRWCVWCGTKINSNSQCPKCFSKRKDTYERARIIAQKVRCAGATFQRVHEVLEQRGFNESEVDYAVGEVNRSQHAFLNLFHQQKGGQL